MRLRLFLLTSVLLCMSCSSDANNLSVAAESKQFPEFNQADYKLVHQFYSKDKEPLGNVYAKYISDDVFTSMVIKINAEGRNEILYFIDSTRLIKKDGIDIEVFAEGFYGYKVVLAKDDYIVINYLRNKGKNVSDDITIEWNYAEKKFQMMKAP